VHILVKIAMIYNNRDQTVPLPVLHISSCRKPPTAGLMVTWPM